MNGAWEGLKGKARDSEGEVTFAGLASYVSRCVSKNVPDLVLQRCAAIAESEGRLLAGTGAVGDQGRTAGVAAAIGT